MGEKNIDGLPPIGVPTWDRTQNPLVYGTTLQPSHRSRATTFPSVHCRLVRLASLLLLKYARQAPIQGFLYLFSLSWNTLPPAPLWLALLSQ